MEGLWLERTADQSRLLIPWQLCKDSRILKQKKRLEEVLGNPMYSYSPFFLVMRKSRPEGLFRKIHIKRLSE